MTTHTQLLHNSKNALLLRFQIQNPNIQRTKTLAKTMKRTKTLTKNHDS